MNTWYVGCSFFTWKRSRYWPTIEKKVGGGVEDAAPSGKYLVARTQLCLCRPDEPIFEFRRQNGFQLHCLWQHYESVHEIFVCYIHDIQIYGCVNIIVLSTRYQLFGLSPRSLYLYRLAPFDCFMWYIVPFDVDKGQCHT